MWLLTELAIQPTC